MANLNTGASSQRLNPISCHSGFVATRRTRRLSSRLLLGGHGREARLHADLPLLRLAEIGAVLERIVDARIHLDDRRLGIDPFLLALADQLGQRRSPVLELSHETHPRLGELVPRHGHARPGHSAQLRHNVHLTQRRA